MVIPRAHNSCIIDLSFDADSFDVVFIAKSCDTFP